MATTVHEPPKIELDRLTSHGAGNGGWRNLVPADGDLRKVKDHSPPPASTGIWVGLAGITMTFAAFTSALVVRQGGAPDWQHITLPPILYLNTLIIIASSVTLEIARRRIASFMGGAKDRAENPARWLYITLFLGLVVRCRANFRLDAIAGAGPFPRHQHQLFVFLCADGGPRPASARRPWRPGARHWQVEPFCPETQYPGRHFALLALYGRSVGVFACVALDEALNH